MPRLGPPQLESPASTRVCVPDELRQKAQDEAQDEAMLREAMLREAMLREAHV